MKITISTDKSLIDTYYVHEYLSNKSYWAKKRSFEKVEASIQGSLCFVVLKDKNQIGFARVVSDQATFAYLADLFIDEHHRKKGYSKMLLDTIMAHPDLQTIDRWMLLTGDAHKLYKKYGFRKLKRAKWVMEYLPYKTKAKPRGPYDLKSLLSR